MCSPRCSYNTPDAEPEAAVAATDLPAELPVYDAVSLSATTSSARLEPTVWHKDVRPDLVHRALVWQQKNDRTTLYKAKDRAEVRGGGKKPWRQKGTGRARHGSTRSPLWRGGGKAHGPVFRSWGIRLNKRVRAAALRVALSAKLRDGRIVVVDALPDFPAVGAEAEAAPTGAAPPAASEPQSRASASVLGAAPRAVKTKAVKSFVTSVLDSLQGFERKQRVKEARKAVLAAAAKARSVGLLGVGKSGDESVAADDAAEAEAEAVDEETKAIAARSPRHSAQNAQPSVLLVDVAIPGALRKGTANLKRVRALAVRGLNVRDVVWAHTLVISRAALEAVNAGLTPATDKTRFWSLIEAEAELAADEEAELLHGRGSAAAAASAAAAL